MAVVTLEEAKQYLRVDSADEDAAGNYGVPESVGGVGSTLSEG